MTAAPATRRPLGLAAWLAVAAVVGWWAAFSLTMERLHLLQNPGATASCDFSVLVQCGKNLESWQGALFGFPNPILGLTGWMAPLVVAVGIVSGARFARWFWLLFWAGLALAMGFVVWLVIQSVYVLGTLCPWCLVTWAVTIPTFYAVTVHLARIGVFGGSVAVRDRADRLMVWVPLASILSYAVIAVLAQLRLDWLGSLF